VFVLAPTAPTAQPDTAADRSRETAARQYLFEVPRVLIDMVSDHPRVTITPLMEIRQRVADASDEASFLEVCPTEREGAIIVLSDVHTASSLRQRAGCAFPEDHVGACGPRGCGDDRLDGIISG
jgi:hypothetical protein